MLSAQNSWLLLKIVLSLAPYAQFVYYWVLDFSLQPAFRK